MRRRFVVTPLPTLLASACLPVKVLNALAPKDGLTVHRDIAYASGPRRQLDFIGARDEAGG
jgi:hypothetical protein